MTPEKIAYERNKLQKRLLRLSGKAISDFAMIGPGDKVMVCLSGGKDSFSLLDLLLIHKDRAPFEFSIVAVNLDQKQPGFPDHILPEYLKSLGVDFHIENQDTYSVVKRVIPEGKTMCSLCSRLRRGILYRVAEELGATKIALGHHRDDILETFFLNLFYAGQMKGMPPKLISDNGKHIVIRPLAYVEEKDLERFSEWRQYPIIPCNLCGSQANLKRREVKQLMRDWEKRFPGRVDQIFAAMSRVTPSHLMDARRYDFVNLKGASLGDETDSRAERDSGAPLVEEGDRLFDEDENLVLLSPLPLSTEQTEEDPYDEGISPPQAKSITRSVIPLVDLRS